MKSKRIAIIGGGPIGVEAAVFGRRLGFDTCLFEEGEVGAHVMRWGHVRLFTPWEMNRSPWGAAAAAEVGLALGEDGLCPTGSAYVTEYLRPLARRVLDPSRLFEGSSVCAIGRSDAMKSDFIQDAQRSQGPFRLLVRQGDVERYEEAEIVIDVTGVSEARDCGRCGVPALGLDAVGDRVERWIPDVLGRQQELYAGRTVLVVGSGYSSATTVRDLLALRKIEPDTQIYWSMAPGRQLVAIEADPLQARAELTGLARSAASGETDGVSTIGSSWVTRFRSEGDRIHVELETAAGSREIVVDRVVSNVGFRPHLGMTRELQVHRCYATEGPMKLSAYLLSQSGRAVDCLAQTTGGIDVLVNPEPNFYILGARSYGRSSNFLLRVGFDQIEELFESWAHT
jgi:hypothetical protein